MNQTVTLEVFYPHPPERVLNSSTSVPALGNRVPKTTGQSAQLVKISQASDRFREEFDPLAVADPAERA
jgi:hypothetical protein